MDANLLHISYEGGNLEDPWSEAEDDMWRWTVSPEEAPDEATYLNIRYQKGDIVAVNIVEMSPATVIEHLNKVAGANGVGRLDIVENRYVGMKSRGCYETPAGAVMKATAPSNPDPGSRSGSPERRVDAKIRQADLQRLLVGTGRLILQAAIDQSQAVVNGEVE